LRLPGVCSGTFCRSYKLLEVPTQYKNSSHKYIQNIAVLA